MNIGVLNSGGDSPGLNAVIEGVVGAASRRGWNVVGFYDGFEGLLSEEGDERFEWLTPAACRGLRAKGGTILGTVNKGNFAIKVGVDQKGAIEPAVLEKTKATVRRLGLDALIVVGGDGSQSTALLLSEIGLPVVGVPKTIDNDLGATDVTFGFYSAVSIVSESLDRLETTANAHQRMMVVEVMGRHAGWIALEGGIAGSADVILLPEIPFLRAWLPGSWISMELYLMGPVWLSNWVCWLIRPRGSSPGRHRQGDCQETGRSYWD